MAVAAWIRRRPAFLPANPAEGVEDTIRYAKKGPDSGFFGSFCHETAGCGKCIAENHLGPFSLRASSHQPLSGPPSRGVGAGRTDALPESHLSGPQKAVFVS